MASGGSRIDLGEPSEKLAILLQTDVSNTLISRLISLRVHLSDDREASVASDSLGYGKAALVAHPDDAQAVPIPFPRKNGTPGPAAPL